MIGLLLNYLRLQWQSGYSDTFPKSQRCQCKRGTLYFLLQTTELGKNWGPRLRERSPRGLMESARRGSRNPRPFLVPNSVQVSSSCLKLLVKPQPLPVGIVGTRLLILDVVGALPVEVAALGARDEDVVVASVTRWSVKASSLAVWTARKDNQKEERGEKTPPIRIHLCSIESISHIRMPLFTKATRRRILYAPGDSKRVRQKFFHLSLEILFRVHTMCALRN